MKSVLQRVTSASVYVNESDVGHIGRGIVILLSVAPTDTLETARQFVAKLRSLAIFADNEGKLSLSLEQHGGSILLVSQFTLHADLDKGRRPSFSRAAKPDHAKTIVDAVRDFLRQANIDTQTGQFGAHMQVTLTNDGPVTMLLDVDED